MNDRRKFLAAMAGVAALSGCVAEENEKTETPEPDEIGPGTSATPPTQPGQDVDSEVWQYVLDSLEYQNRALEQLLREQ